MKRHCLGFFFAFALTARPLFADPEDVVFLYQPDQILATRLIDVKELADLTIVTQEVWKEILPSKEVRSKTAVVVAFGEGYLLQAWALGEGVTKQHQHELTKKLQTQRIPRLKEGFVAISIRGKNLNASAGTVGDPNFTAPVPPEWIEVTKKENRVMHTDEILEKIMIRDDTKAPYLTRDRTVEKIPEGFVVQILEPTGGKIVRPKEWYYAERHGGAGYTWILSKENLEKGPYETGLRIETIVGVKELTGKSPKQFVLDFIDGKKKTADKAIDGCMPKDQGMFTCVCLETEEGPFHILYNAFWGNGMDIVLVSTAGAKREEWDKYKNTFIRMGNFELIDMKRFEKQEPRLK